MTIPENISARNKLFKAEIATEPSISKAWNFYIGGYQPAQKWLKDHTLSFDDILHYQRIIVALSETDRVMGEIDKII